MKDFQLGLISIGSGLKPAVIAELSANHNGSLANALQAIQVIKASGADAIKIQSYTPDTMTIDSDQDDFRISDGLWKGYTLYDLYSKAHTPFDWHQAIFSRASDLGITCFSTPFDESALEFLEGLNCPGYKIASFEATDLPLIEAAASTGKPLIVSTGMASLDEISEAIECAKSNGCEHLVVLHCISAYPAPLQQYNLKTMCDIRKRFEVHVGLSDHSLSNTAAISAVALGAVLIEKHFTLRRADGGFDSSFSLEPGELRGLCEEVSRTHETLGRVNYDLKDAERNNIKFRRSLYFVTDLKVGQVVQPSDIRRVRPGFGLPPKFYSSVVGKKLAKTVHRGTPVAWECFVD